jgi:hypothetical protein
MENSNKLINFAPSICELKIHTKKKTEHKNISYKIIYVRTWTQDVLCNLRLGGIWELVDETLRSTCVFQSQKQTHLAKNTPYHLII